MISDPFINPDVEDNKKYVIPEFAIFGYETDMSITDLIQLGFTEINQVLEINYHYILLYALGWLFYEKADFAQAYFDDIEFDDPKFEIECDKAALKYFTEASYQGYEKALEMKIFMQNEY